MFENVLAQESVIRDLTQSIREKTVPGSMLFEGPVFSGKLTTSLELARILTCEEVKAPWNCPCRACSDQRLLIHEDTKLLGPGSFMPEVYAAADVLRRVQTPAARFLFVRAVRKLMRRLDSELWDETNKKYKSAQSSIELLFDLLEAVAPDSKSDSVETSEKTLEKIIQASAKLSDLLPREVPVDQVRRLLRWAFRTTGGRAKVAIIANAEKMGDSSRNALLKTLEEPPEDTYFILTSSSPDALLPTIRSRLRPHRFKDRSNADSRVVLERIFRETSGEYESLREYFLAWSLPPDILRHETATFVDAVLSDSHEAFFGDNRDLDRLTVDRDVFLSFLSQLVTYMMNHVMRHENNGNQQIDMTSLLACWNNEVRSVVDAVQRFNISPAAGLESLFYKLRQVT